MAIDWTSVNGWYDLIEVMPQCGIPQSECDRLRATIDSAVDDFGFKYDDLCGMDYAWDWFLRSDGDTGWFFNPPFKRFMQNFESAFQSLVSDIGRFYPGISVTSWADVNKIPHSTPGELDAARAFLSVYIDPSNAVAENIAEMVGIALYKIEAPFGLSLYVPAFGLYG